MKTAMQELMDWMEQTEFMVNRGFIDKIHECLEKEKIDIKMAFNDGKITGAFKKVKNSDDYYNETYNQNK